MPAVRALQTLATGVKRHSPATCGADKPTSLAFLRGLRDFHIVKTIGINDVFRIQLSIQDSQLTSRIGVGRIESEDLLQMIPLIFDLITDLEKPPMSINLLIASRVQVKSPFEIKTRFTSVSRFRGSNTTHKHMMDGFRHHSCTPQVS
jgi:hypothetical protein